MPNSGSYEAQWAGCPEAVRQGCLWQVSKAEIGVYRSRGVTEGCHPGQASPLHAHQGTRCCDSAHISGRNGASSCLRSSLSQLWGTRWIRAARSLPPQRQTPSFCLFSLVGKPPSQPCSLETMFPGRSSIPHRCFLSWALGGVAGTHIKAHTQTHSQSYRGPGGSRVSLLLLGPRLTKVNWLLATRTSPAHGSS